MAGAQCLIVMACLAISAGVASAQDAPSPVVSLCQNDEQPGNGSNLATAIYAAKEWGHDVTFACPPGSTIAVNKGGYEVPAGLTIDGQNKVTLDAGAGDGISAPLFIVKGGEGWFVLRNIKIKGAALRNLPASSVVDAQGDVYFDNVTIERSTRAVRTQKALQVVNSNFIGNSGFALGADGPLTIIKSQFISNTRGNAVVANSMIEVADSKFIDNDVSIGFSRGSIKRTLFQGNRYITIASVRVEGGTGATDGVGGNIDIEGSTFTGNPGGGILLNPSRSPATITLRNNVFTNNGHESLLVVGRQGPDLPPVKLQLNYNRFEKNKGETAGAVALRMDRGIDASIDGGIFVGNESTSAGGAISWSGGTLRVAHSVFRANRAAGDGGALFGRDLPPGSQFVISNSLVAESRSPGSAVVAPWGTLLNVTIANNRSAGVSFSGPGSRIANSIFSENALGNCASLPAGATGPGNFQAGAGDCPGVGVEAPFLDAMYVPKLGSGPSAGGDVATCSAHPVRGLDLAFQRRVAGKCSSGAFEKPPVQMARAKKNLTRTCADGTTMTSTRPCPEELKSCPSGESVPESAVCPEPVRTCPGGEILPVSVQCPTKTCPGGSIIPISQQCPPQCAPGCQGTYPDCRCPCPAPCTGTRPNCVCPCSCNYCGGPSCVRPKGVTDSCACNLPYPQSAPKTESYCFVCVK